MSARMTADEARAALASMTDADFPTAETNEELSEEQYVAFVRDARTAGRPSLGKAGTQSPQITIRLPADLNARLRARADAEHITVSQWTRRLVERELAAA